MDYEIFRNFDFNLSASVKNWKNEMDQALYTMNEKKYSDVLNAAEQDFKDE